MKFNSNSIICILAAICHCYSATSSDESIHHRPSSRSLLFFPILPIPKPESNNNHKPFSIFSRPPSHHNKPEDENQPDKKPGGIISHVGNVLQGGSIGFEIRPLAPLQGILDHAKKFIPGHGHGTVGRPSHEGPDDKPPHLERPDHPDKDRPHHERPNYERPHHERPNHERPHHERPNHERPNYERPHHERPNYERPHHERPPQERPIFERPHQQRPNYDRPNKDKPDQPNKDEIEHPSEPSEDWEVNKPQKKPVVPSWDDLGEVSANLEDDYGEGVLQPRRRPKRFVESKIYHVPLMYRSNGRIERVRFRSRSGVRKQSNVE